MLGLNLAPAVFVAWSSLIFQDPSKIQMQTEKLTEGVYMLVGSGGNIGVSVGKDGVFLIDDQFAPLTEKIKEAVAKISDKPIRFVLNTHWHGDHTGGNENLGKAGVIIVAHENVRKRMSVEQFMEFFGRKTPPSPEAALPVITFTDSVRFHLNDDTIEAFHVAPAHTDGDSVIHFRKANCIHMGDLYFNGRYPFIDLSSGGSLDGVIAAVERVLNIADEKTKIIPGHGALSNRAELVKYGAMLQIARERLWKLVQAGKSLDEVKAAKPLADLDPIWDGGFISSEKFIEIAYRSLSLKPAEKK